MYRGDSTEEEGPAWMTTGRRRQVHRVWGQEGGSWEPTPHGLWAQQAGDLQEVGAGGMEEGPAKQPWEWAREEERGGSFCKV